MIIYVQIASRVQQYFPDIVIEITIQYIVKCSANDSHLHSLIVNRVSASKYTVQRGSISVYCSIESSPQEAIGGIMNHDMTMKQGVQTKNCKLVKDRDSDTTTITMSLR